MKNAFLKENIFNRKFGGKRDAEPYVTGTHFIWFDSIPSLADMYTDLSDDDIKRVLASTCLSVTPPGGTLNKIEFTGLGGIKWAVPGNIDYGTSITIKFFEFTGTPLLSIIHSWIKLIRDYRTGVAFNTSVSKEQYTNENYAGTLFYWTTAPDGMTIEYYAGYDSVFPLKDPQDLFTSDVETQGKLDIEIEFNCDTPYHEDWVKTKCQGFMKMFETARDGITSYQNI